MAATSRRTEPSPPQRPSISPLSVAKSSPTAFRDSMAQDEKNDEDGISGLGRDATSVEMRELQDDRSSSLSEVEDDEEEDSHLLDVKYRISIGNGKPAADSHDVDSEAETERLEQTPTKSRRHEDGPGKTPSKLSQAATAEDLSDPPSPLPDGSGGDSSIGTTETNGKKRKRSDTAESSLSSAESDLGESPRKRSHESPTEETTAGDEGAEDDANESESALAQDDIGDTVEAPVAQSTRGGWRGGRRGGRKGGKPRTESAKEIDLEEQPLIQVEEEQDEESAARTAEKLQHRGPASSIFEDLAKHFANIHEKVYDEKLALLSAELDMLNQPECKHPDYMRQVACLDARHAKQVNEVQAYYRYKMQTLRISTLAERSQLHSQYFQTAREVRESAHYQLGEDWYKIQKERRQIDKGQDGQYLINFPTKRSEQLRNQAKYNQEVSVLSGIAKYVGFPAAPAIQGAEGAGSDALENDLKAMQVPKRIAQPATTNSTPAMFLPNRFSEPHADRIAHEQFIEQNAWARPVGPIPNHGTPNLTHTPDWANAGNGTSKYRHVSTPIVQRNAANTSSDPTETKPITSQSAPPPQQPNLDQPQQSPILFGKEPQRPSSPITVPKHRQNGNGGEPQRELTGFRNFSNISGTSTIDAPPDSAEKDRDKHGERERDREVNRERDRERERDPKETPIQQTHALQREASAPHSVFETSQIHRFGPGSPGSVGVIKPETYANPTSFRPREGMFGTPTPVPTPAIGVAQGTGKS